MRATITVILLIFILFASFSCRKSFEFEPSTGNLEFSKDTVFLDTIFSNIGSSTYSLIVYNPTRDDLEIPSIRLQQGLQSSYRLNVDGVPGKEFQNVPILAKDSMYIFIETTFDVSSINQNEFLHTDKLLFDVDMNEQEVELVTLVKDAVFLYPTKNSEGLTETISLGLNSVGNEVKVEGFFLEDQQLQFTNQKPYVIYGYAAVADGKTLSMQAGTRVHFHKDSGIYIAGGGKLQIDGSLSTDQESLENEVVFEGDRLESEFENIPGQWGTIWMASGSIENTIDYLTIKNATVGLMVEGDGILASPTLTIKNSQINNSSNINFWAKSASITGYNLVLGGAGSHSLYCNLGGNYNFKHCTIANYWIHGFRTGNALKIDNHFGEQANDLTGTTFINCIIDGSKSQELSLDSNGQNTFDFSFTNCLITFEKNNSSSNDPLYDFENSDLFLDNLLNQSPGFVDSFGGDFKIDATSAAKDNAQLQTALQVPLDLLGIDRTLTPDIGAYELSPQN